MKWRVTVDLTHPEEVIADDATLEKNGALTFRTYNDFVVCYAPGVWRKLEQIKETKTNQSLPTEKS